MTAQRVLKHCKVLTHCVATSLVLLLQYRVPGMCSTGHSRSSAYQCSKCATGYKAGAVALLAVLAAILAFVLFYVISDLIDVGGAGDAVGAGRSGTSAVPQCGMLCHSLSFLPWQSLR
eukprot:1115-Heterococcus_DN1.PRE.1